MAKSKVSEKDPKKQEDIKAILGTVSYDLFDNLYNHHENFVSRVNLLAECAISDGKSQPLMELICYLTEQDHGDLKPLMDRARAEREVQHDKAARR
jgi:hypothetical protein